MGRWEEAGLNRDLILIRDRQPSAVLSSILAGRAHP